MFSKISSLGLAGLDAYPVTIEADIAPGLPSLTIVGLPDNAVRESRERVRSAIKNSGYLFPSCRITLNLSPADTKKEGPGFDLAIALSILSATGLLPKEVVSPFIFLGQLSLDGSISPIAGALSCAMAVDPKRHRGLFVPLANAAEAALGAKVPIYPVSHLSEAIATLFDPSSMPTYLPSRTENQTRPCDLDFSDVKGQAQVKRGLEIAAAGSHNVLLIGPPGSGKTMLAKRLVSILPDLTMQEALEITRVQSVTGTLKIAGLCRQRPFRSPHHTASDIALVGGGTYPKPGEVSLAHHGILFLDELPEFRRSTLEVLRQPMEDHHVSISRAARTLKFPARFMLVAAMNPCPCGHFGRSGQKPCRCSSLEIERYSSKISGPLLDRIDIHLEVPAVKYQELIECKSVEGSAPIRERVNRARTMQIQRFGKDSGAICNAAMTHMQTRQHCNLGSVAKDLLRRAMTELQLSARAYDKILKVARTIADLAGSDNIQASHVAEAIGYRTLDRNK